MWHGNWYHKFRTQQIRLSWCDKHGETCRKLACHGNWYRAHRSWAKNVGARYKLSRHGNRRHKNWYHACRSRTKTHCNLACRMYWYCRCAVDAIPVGDQAMTDKNWGCGRCFSIFMLWIFSQKNGIGDLFGEGIRTRSYGSGLYKFWIEMESAWHLTNAWP